MKLGDIDIHLLSDGSFGLDGGAMFGVVPKVLWERTNPPDEKNRIKLGLNSLLIIRDQEKILVDTGIGNKFDSKFGNMYAVRREQTLLERLQALDIAPAEITHVILTHLHFDHIGWSTIRDRSGKLIPTFPRATYFCQRGEFDYALDCDPRSHASYVQENFVPLEEHGVLEFIEGSREIIPGIESVVTGGHTRFHMIIKVASAGKTACFLADLVPTTSHFKTPYVMGYDLFPAQTMAIKPIVLKQAIEEQWLLIFEHDPEVKAGYLNWDNGNYKLDPVKID